MALEIEPRGCAQPSPESSGGERGRGPCPWPPAGGAGRGPGARGGGQPPPAAAGKPLRVVELRPGHAPNVHTQVVLLEKGPTQLTPDRTQVCQALCADHTAAVGLQLWGEEVAAFQPGDILRLTGGMFNFATARKVRLSPLPSASPPPCPPPTPRDGADASARAPLTAVAAGA